MTTSQDHAATTAATTPQLGRYAIDRSGSALTFRTRHLFGLAPVRGSFAVRAGTVDVAEPFAESGVYAEIEAASFRTRNGQRDRNVRSASFLDADRYPVMTFRSQRITDRDLDGTLTVRGVTQPVRLAVERLEVSARSFTVRASTRLDRTAFGVTASPGMAGRHLDVSLEVRCVRE